MTDVFLYGTLRCEPLLKQILGPDSQARLACAMLADHAVFWAKDKPFPLIEAAPGQIADGLLLTGLSEEDLQRMNYYEGGFAYRLLPRNVQSEGGMHRATVYFPQPGQWSRGLPWSLEEWERRYGAMALRAAGEIMRGFGKRSAGDLMWMRPQIEVRAASWVRARAERIPQDVRRGFTAADVEIGADRQPYAKFFAVQEQDIRFRRFAGGMSPMVERAAFVLGDAVTVLPYDPVRDRVLVVEQFRFGPLVRGDAQPWSLEPIAGRLDPGEGPEAAARREAAEEAGLALQDLHHIGSYYPSPGAVSEYLYSYVALADLPDEAARLGGVESEAEDIRGVLVSFDALMGLLTSGEAQNGPLILSALWLAVNRGRLRGNA